MIKRVNIYLSLFMLLALSVLCQDAHAQRTATVKSFSQTTDHIQSSDRRKDLNGTLCALIKVQVVDEIERIEGNKIGKIVNKGVEKWIYMCKGSRNVRIHLKNHLPVKVMFQDYGIKGLESNRVYELILNEERAPETKQSLIINYSPANATVMVDSKLVKGNGRIELKLPVGDHTYLIAAEGYNSAQATITLNESSPREITEKLIEDNSSVNPYQTVQVEQEEYIAPAYTQSVNVGVNGNLLTVKVSPFYAKIKIDGKPYEADGDGEVTVPLLYGIHKVRVEADGYEPQEVPVDIKKKGMTKKIKLSEEKGSEATNLKKGMILMNSETNIEAGKNGNMLILSVKPTQGVKLSVDGVAYRLEDNVKVKSMVFALPYGAHDVKIDCEGYQTETFSVNIGKSKVERAISLKKNKKNKQQKSYSVNGITVGQDGNEVLFSVSPIYAKIIVNGQTFSPNLKGQLIMVLPYGIHRASIEADGYFSEQVSINVGKNSVKKKIKLKKLPKKKR